ncbi:hypothetical protein A2960_00335 [Candidatus Gottesmanbacteria bacterium RIFCSPLOWO2_01_FULL_39_12b]|uniref:RNA polymerase subunit sigma-24 n=1 Tax=Candidatus Gottesmanbacteria bacterium RIFCSPLOWO2_01_FULL_39_12b TaxID=1798388 RepID=A0A1F6ARY1_9BACT|nr:MAG: hypothetical protein A2960_00335 [Candidatus Gottesmanbacteria bacterium RIFCSPLOWO2_01_FULL_39_12b]
MHLLSLYKKKKSALNIFTDKILVYKVKKGDKEAYGKLYLKYFDSIYRYIFFRVNQNRQDAEDITEIVFFKAWKGFEAFDEERAGFRAWIYKITHNQVIDFYKKDNRKTTLDETVIDEKQNLEENVLQNLEHEHTLKAIEKLPLDQKEIIIMKFIEGLSNQEIGSVLGKKENAVRALQFRALKKLHKMLTSYGKPE